MQPITDPYSGSCSAIISSSCVKWSTDLTLSAITLVKGQSLTDVILNLANAINSVQTTIDVANIDLQCLENCSCILDCSDDPPLTDVIECLIKSHCEVKVIVDALDAGLVYEDIVFDCAHVWSTTTKLTGTPTEAQLYNYLIALICEVYDRTKNDLLQSEINALDLRVTNLETLITSGTGTPIIVTVDPGCHTIWAVATEVPSAVSLLANRLKALEKLVLNTDRGSNITNCNAPTIPLDTEEVACISDMNSALTTWGYAATIFDDYTTIEDKFRALLKVNCALIDRMTTTYDTIQTCCGKDCSDYELALIATRNVASTSFTVTWNSAIGIPNFGTPLIYPQFTSCTTTPRVKFTDGNGDFTYVNVSFSSIDTNFLINDSVLTTGGLDINTTITAKLELCYILTNEDTSTSTCDTEISTTFAVEAISQCRKATFNHNDTTGAVPIYNITGQVLNTGSGYNLPAALDVLATGYYISDTVPVTCDGQLYAANAELKTLFDEISSEVSNVAHIRAYVTNTVGSQITIVFENTSYEDVVIGYNTGDTTIYTSPLTCPTCV